MSLQITSNKEAKVINSRSYSFKCQGCDWSFNTPTVAKIKSLTKYIVDLESSTVSHGRFESLRQFYHVRNTLNSLSSKQAPLKFDSLDATNLNSWWKRAASGEPLWKLLNEENANPLGSLNHHEEQLPSLTKLTPKYNYFCPYCKSCMTRMDATPNVVKWVKTSPAYTGIPHLSVVPTAQYEQNYEEFDSDNTLMLLIENSRQHKTVTVKINSEESLMVPHHELEILSSASPGERPKDRTQQLQAILRSSPTYTLNASPDSDKLLRVENTRRLGALIKKPMPENLRIVDQGDGWMIIPLKVINRKPRYEIDVMVRFEDWNLSMSAFIDLDRPNI
ncbi:unnamed protein product [Kluyveromyces dobzhanskii CBS 2104]|uniref:WGS project CCBQ000000000 data, contig 00043 n=1 Tax=Kluyveromyces dobzhanskii CBS 2104 TaxID=1427455 RepID=A0A0A8L5A5_9SACH|nr:unnamed protein product [Kluyveromyces dobzhanskii CBS 2104]